MKPTYITVLVAVVVGSGVAAIGFVSAGHGPADDPSNVVIYEVHEVHQGSNAQICVEDMEGPVNKVIMEGNTTHLNTSIWHQGEAGDVVVQIPRAHTPEGRRLVLFTNEENVVIEALQGFCTPPGTNVTVRLVLGAYYLTTGHIELTKGGNVTTGPGIADDAPAPGIGSLGELPTVDSASDSDGSTVSDPNQTDDVFKPTVTDDHHPDIGETDYLTNETNETVGDSLEETKNGMNTVVEHVLKPVHDALDTVLGDDPGPGDAA